MAKRITVYLEHWERHPVINATPPAETKRLRPYYNARAAASGRFVVVGYVSYQGDHHLTGDQARQYLTILDAGWVGKHGELLRQFPVGNKVPTAPRTR